MPRSRTTCNWFYRPRVVTSLLLLAASTLALSFGCSSSPANLEPEARQYSFWPRYPADPRVQFLVSYRYSSDIEPPKTGLNRLVFGERSGVLPINKPYGVEMQDGKIYVCDIRNAGVVILDLVKHQTRVMVSNRFGGMSQPVDLAIAPDGKKYVSDIQRGLVFVFDAKDRAIAAHGWSGLKPSGVAVYEDLLYISDFSSQSVVVVDRHTGEHIRSIGEPGSDDGQFVRPLGVATDPSGNIYVTDVIKCRIQKFSPSGELLSAYGEIGDTAGSFVRPKHIAVHQNGITHIVDAAFQNVQMFNDEGQVLMFFGSAGNHPGSMDLPAGVSVTSEGLDLFDEYIHPGFDADYLVLVTNQFGRNKVSVYAVGALREGYTVQDLEALAAPVSAGVEQEEGPASPTPVLPEFGSTREEEPSGEADEDAPSSEEPTPPGEPN